MARPRPLFTLADFAPLAILFLVALFFHRTLLFAPQVIVGDDVLLQNLPETKLVHESLDAGKLPLWTPLSLTGYPFYAEGQAGLFYPPTMALHRGVIAATKRGHLPHGDSGFRLVFQLELFLHHLALSLLLYLFARQLELSVAASMLASLAISYGGFVTGHLIHQNLIRSLPYLPLLWMFSLRGHATKDAGSARDLAFHGVALGLLFVAGHHQTAVMTGIAWVAFVAWLESTHPYGPHGLLRRTLARVAPATLLGLALAAVQLLPTLELFTQSIRAQAATYSERAAWSLTPVQFIHWVLPFLFGTERADTPYFGQGHFREMASYVGLVPLVLVGIMRPWWSASSAARFFGGLGVLGLFLALGAYSPLYPLHLVPPLSFFRNPCRFVLFVELALAFLSARALDDLVAGEQPERVQAVMDRYPLGRVALLGLVFIAGAGLLYKGAGGGFTAPRSGGYTQVAPDTRGEFSAESLKTKPAARMRASLHAAVQGGAIALAILLLVRLVIGLRVVGLMVPAMCGIWLAMIGGGDVVFGFATRVWETGDLRRLIYEPGPFNHIRSQAPRDRVFIDPFPTQRQLPAYVRWRFHAANLFSNVHSVAGYLGPLTPRAWVEYFRDASTPPQPGFDVGLSTIARLDPIRDHWKLSLAGVTWLLTANKVESKHWRAHFAEEEFTLYRNARALPRAFLVRTIAPLAAGVKAADVLPELNEKLPCVTLETPKGTFVAGRVMAAGEQLSHSEVGGDEVLLLAHLRAPGWLVVSDLAYPGWKCFVNGSLEPTTTANGAFRAVRLDKGVWDIRFSFQPDVFRHAAWITLAALAATIMLLGASLFSTVPEQETPR
jgi:hypothetical protein